MNLSADIVKNLEVLTHCRAPSFSLCGQMCMAYAPYNGGEIALILKCSQFQLKSGQPHEFVCIKWR